MQFSKTPLAAIQSLLGWNWPDSSSDEDMTVLILQHLLFQGAQVGPAYEI